MERGTGVIVLVFKKQGKPIVILSNERQKTLFEEQTKEDLNTYHVYYGLKEYYGNDKKHGKTATNS